MGEAKVNAAKAKASYEKLAKQHADLKLVHSKCAPPVVRKAFKMDDAFASDPDDDDDELDF